MGRQRNSRSSRRNSASHRKRYSKRVSRHSGSSDSESVCSCSDCDTAYSSDSCCDCSSCCDSTSECSCSDSEQQSSSKHAVQHIPYTTQYTQSQTQQQQQQPQQQYPYQQQHQQLHSQPQPLLAYSAHSQAYSVPIHNSVAQQLTQSAAYHHQHNAQPVHKPPTSAAEPPLPLQHSQVATTTILSPADSIQSPVHTAMGNSASAVACVCYRCITDPSGAYCIHRLSEQREPLNADPQVYHFPPVHSHTAVENDTVVGEPSTATSQQQAHPVQLQTEMTHTLPPPHTVNLTEQQVAALPIAHTFLSAGPVHNQALAYSAPASVASGRGTPSSVDTVNTTIHYSSSQQHYDTASEHVQYVAHSYANTDTQYVQRGSTADASSPAVVNSNIARADAYDISVPIAHSIPAQATTAVSATNIVSSAANTDARDSYRAVTVEDEMHSARSNNSERAGSAATRANASTYSQAQQQSTQPSRRNSSPAAAAPARARSSPSLKRAAAAPPRSTTPSRARTASRSQSRNFSAASGTSAQPRPARLPSRSRVAAANQTAASVTSATAQSPAPQPPAEPAATETVEEDQHTVLLTHILPTRGTHSHRIRTQAKANVHHSLLTANRQRSSSRKAVTADLSDVPVTSIDIASVNEPLPAALPLVSTTEDAAAARVAVSVSLPADALKTLNKQREQLCLSPLRLAENTLTCVERHARHTEELCSEPNCNTAHHTQSQASYRSHQQSDSARTVHSYIPPRAPVKVHCLSSDHTHHHSHVHYHTVRDELPAPLSHRVQEQEPEFVRQWLKKKAKVKKHNRSSSTPTAEEQSSNAARRRRDSASSSLAYERWLLAKAVEFKAKTAAEAQQAELQELLQREKVEAKQRRGSSAFQNWIVQYHNKRCDEKVKKLLEQREADQEKQKRKDEAHKAFRSWQNKKRMGAIIAKQKQEDARELDKKQQARSLHAALSFIDLNGDDSSVELSAVEYDSDTDLPITQHMTAIAARLLRRRAASREQSTSPRRRYSSSPQRARTNACEQPTSPDSPLFYNPQQDSFL